MQSQEKHNPIYYAQVKTDYESTWQMQLQVPTGAHLLETVTKLEASKAKTFSYTFDRRNKVLDSLTLTEQ